MDTTTTLTFGERLQGSFEQLYGYVPALFGALVILFAGYLLARLLEKGTDRLMRRIHLNHILERGGVMQAVERSGSRVNPTRVAGSLVFWFVMFAVMLVAVERLTGWLREETIRKRIERLSGCVLIAFGVRLAVEA